MVEVLDGRVSYVLRGYPVISQTFVRNEILALRRAGCRVEVDSMGLGDRTTISQDWSGPYTAMTDTSWPEAVRDALWWVRRPVAVARLLRAVVRCRGAEPTLLLRGVLSSARRLHRQDVRVVHTHFGWRGIVPALYVAALLGVPCTITLHAADIFLPSPRLTGRLRAMAGIITVCRSNTSHVMDLGVPEEKIHIVPCGVDTDVEAPPPTTPDHFVSVGRLVAKKGFDVLLDAFAVVVREHPQARLTIAGDGPLRSELEDQVSRLGLGDHVVVLGATPNDDVLRLVVESGVFVLACRRLPNGDSDAMPVALREAMVRARPVISTAVAGIPESVDDTVGWLVPSEDSEALAAAMLEAVDDPVRAAERGAAGRSRVLATASLDSSAETQLAIWRRVG